MSADDAAAHTAHGVAAKAGALFHRHRSQPVHEVVQRINPILRGWVTYFAIGHAGAVLRVHPPLGGDQTAAVVAPEPAAPGLRLVAMALVAAVPDGGGVPRLSRTAVSSSSRASSLGPITSDAKSAGKRSAGNLHAPFEVAGVGDGPLRGTAPTPDPTLRLLVGGHEALEFLEPILDEVQLRGRLSGRAVGVAAEPSRTAVHPR